MVYPTAAFSAQTYFDDTSDNDGFQETTPKTPQIGKIGYNKTDITEKIPTHGPGIVTDSDLYDFNKAHKIRYRNPRCAQD